MYSSGGLSWFTHQLFEDTEYVLLPLSGGLEHCSR